MTVRSFLVRSLVGAVVGAASWGLIIRYLDPEQAGAIGYALFFLSLFLLIASGMSLLGYGVRRVLTAGQFPAYTVRTSLRQGVWLGLFTSILLLLQLMRLYRWWLAVIIVVLLVSIELVFLGYDRAYRRQNQEA